MRCYPEIVRRAFLVLVALQASCASAGELVAPSGERRLVARDQQSGVTIVLTTGAWDGAPPSLGEEITVIHALVANMGATPIRLAPGDLALVDVRGFRYGLLDPGASFVRVPNDATTAGYDRELERSYDPGRTTDFVPFFAPGDAPARALPWGVLEPGTQMRGFVYFEPVVRTANEVTLTWHIDGIDDKPMFDGVFQFYVARP
jgi:hypothetical protein